MNVIQQFEDEYQEFLDSIKTKEKREGKVSAYHAAPSTLKVSARSRKNKQTKRNAKRKLSLPTISRGSPSIDGETSISESIEDFSSTPKRHRKSNSTLQSEEKIEGKAKPHISLAELETKRLSLPFLETIQYVHLELERRGIRDTGVKEVKVNTEDIIPNRHQSHSKTSEDNSDDDDDEDIDIYMGMIGKTEDAGALPNDTNVLGSSNSLPVFDESTLRKRYPIFCDHLDLQPRIVGQRRQEIWLLQLIEEIYDARYMFEVDEWSIYDSKSTHNTENNGNKKAIDMSKSIRRMHRRGKQKSALDAYSEFLLPRNPQKHNSSGRKIGDMTNADDSTSKEPALSFPIFTYMFLCQLFGLKLLVQQTAWDILYNLELYKEEHPELMAFSLYLREVRDIDTVLFYLHCRHCIQDKHSLHFKLKEKIIPHKQKLKSVVTPSNSDDGSIALFDHPKLHQIRVKEVFLTQRGLFELCESLFTDPKYCQYIRQVILADSFEMKQISGSRVGDELINIPISCIHTTTALNTLVDLFEDTPDEIINTIKYGDDSEGVTMLGKLQETRENKLKMDKLRAKVSNLQRRVQEQEVKVEMLKLKNKGKLRTVIFLEENELWKRKEAVKATELQYKKLDEGNNLVWDGVLGIRKAEIERDEKQISKRKKLVGWKYSVYVDDALQRFEIWVREKHRKWAMTVQVLKLLGKSWEEQLEELKLKYTIMIQRLWRKRVATRKAKEEAQKRLAFEREERRKRNEKRRNAEAALRRRREREAAALKAEMDKKRKMKEDMEREKNRKRRKLRQNAAVHKKMKKLHAKWLRERFARWLMYRRQKKMKMKRFKELLQYVILKWNSKIKLRHMWKEKRIASSRIIQGAWRVFLAKNAAKYAREYKDRTEKKVQNFVRKMKYGYAHTVLLKWFEYSSKMKRVKSFVDKHFGMWCQKCLKSWYVYARAQSILRSESATKIQNCWRRYLGIGNYLKRKMHRDAASRIQCAYRAYLAKGVLQRARKRKLEEEEKIAKSLRKLIWKHAMDMFLSWHLYTTKMGRVRYLVNKGLRDLNVRVFEAWKNRYLVERDSAIIIQGLWRRYSAHIHVTQMLLVTRRATIIQKYWRRYYATLIVKKLRLYRNSATSIQRVWRGFIGRVYYHSCRVNHLLDSVKAKDYEAVERAFQTRSLSGWKGVANPNLSEGFYTDKAGRNSLMIAALVGSKRIIKLCLRNGMDINARDYKRKMCLHYVAEGGYLGDHEICEYLITKGADRNALDIEGKSPLMDAAILERVDLLKLMIELGGKIEQTDIHGQSPLHVTAVIRKAASLQVLLESNADPLSCDNTGCCVLHDVCNRGYDVILGNLLPYCKTIDVQDNNGITPISHACIAKQAECVRKLIWAHADMEISDNNGLTPLHHCVLSKDLASARLLLEAFANVDCLDINVETPLHIACREGNVDMVKLLLGSGANWGIRNWRGNYPIHIAAKQGHAEVLRTLISYEVEVNTLNYDGRTALGEARLVPHHDIIAIFEENFMLESIVDKNREETAAKLLGIALKSEQRDTSTASLMDHIPNRFERATWQQRLMRSELVEKYAEYEEYIEHIDENGQQIEKRWWRNKKTNACLENCPIDVVEEGEWKAIRVLNENGRWYTREYKNSATGEIVPGNKPPIQLKSKRMLQQRPVEKNEEGDLSLVDYKDYWEKEDSILQNILLRKNSSIRIQKNWRGYIGRLYAKRLRLELESCIKIQKVVRGHMGRKKALAWRKQIEVIIDLQRMYRGFSTRKSVALLLPIFRRRRKVCQSAALINRCWRGYLPRRERRQLNWRLYWGPKTETQWRVMRKDGSYLRREVNRWEERVVDQTYDVRFYVDKIRLKCQWDKPKDVVKFDCQEARESVQLRLWGFTKAQERVATKLQAIWRGRQMARTFRLMVKAKKLMVGSDTRYLNNPNSIENMVNYMLYLTCFPPQNYERARVLYSKAFDFMLARGPDNSLILYAYTIFVCSTREEDDHSITDYILRARARPNHKKKFELAEKGYYRMAAIMNPGDAKCQHLYALCLQWVNMDYTQAEEYYIRAMEITNGRDPIIKANFNYMLQKLKGAEYDADDVMRKRALKIANEETSKWMAEEKEYRQKQKAMEDRAARNIQFRWRLRQQGLLDYWLWDMPTMKEKVDINDTGKTELIEDSEKTKTPRLLFDDPREWEECADGYGGTYYYNIITQESQWTKPNFKDDKVSVKTGPGFESNEEDKQISNDFDRDPEKWEICQGEGDAIYYYNCETGESRWRRPRFQTDAEYTLMKEGSNTEEHFAKMELMIQLGNVHKDWESVRDEKGRLYFWNRISGESRWDAPPRSWKPNYENVSRTEANALESDTGNSTTALPTGWSQENDGNGNVYYYNVETGESRWQPPQSTPMNHEKTREGSKSKTSEIYRFEKCDDGNGNVYWYNLDTGESSWEKPQ